MHINSNLRLVWCIIILILVAVIIFYCISLLKAPSFTAFALLRNKCSNESYHFHGDQRSSIPWTIHAYKLAVFSFLFYTREILIMNCNTNIANNITVAIVVCIYCTFLLRYRNAVQSLFGMIKIKTSFLFLLIGYTSFFLCQCPIDLAVCGLVTLESEIPKIETRDSYSTASYN